MYGADLKEYVMNTGYVSDLWEVIFPNQHLFPHQFSERDRAVMQVGIKRLIVFLKALLLSSVPVNGVWFD